jgi:hypothetical protein
MRKNIPKGGGFPKSQVSNTVEIRISHYTNIKKLQVGLYKYPKLYVTNFKNSSTQLGYTPLSNP